MIAGGVESVWSDDENSSQGATSGRIFIKFELICREVSSSIAFSVIHTLLTYTRTKTTPNLCLWYGMVMSKNLWLWKKLKVHLFLFFFSKKKWKKKKKIKIHILRAGSFTSPLLGYYRKYPNVEWGNTVFSNGTDIVWDRRIGIWRYRLYSLLVKNGNNLLFYR